MRPSLERLLAALSTVILVAPLLAQQGGAADAPRAPDAAHDAAPRVSGLQGRAYVDRNRVVTGATVSARAHDDGGTVYLTATGAGGRFSIDGLPDGDYDVHLAREGYLPVSKQQVALRFPFRAVVEVKMEPDPDRRLPTQAVPAVSRPTTGRTFGVRGRVSGGDGAPLGEIYLRLIHAEGLQDPYDLRSGPDGSFAAAGLTEGLWHLQVHGVGYLPIRVELPLERELDVRIQLVPQPADYQPSPLDLMLPEQPLPPKGLAPGDTTRRPS